MSSPSFRAKIAASALVIVGAALLAVLLLRRDPPPSASGKPAAEQPQPPALLAASPPARAATTPSKPQEPATAVGAPAGARVEASKRALSFDVPDCAELKLISTEGAIATVQMGDSEPEQVRVGDLLESGEVTFVGRHPESRAPIMLLENGAKVACRALGLRTFAALTRSGPSSARDFARRTDAPAGDPNRVETMVLKLPPGAKANPAAFRSAELKR